MTAVISRSAIQNARSSSSDPPESTHGTLHVNYTTYDLRRAQENINPNTSHSHIMVTVNEPDESYPHPYWYARVLGIFSVNIDHSSLDLHKPKRMNFLWVR